MNNGRGVKGKFTIYHAFTLFIQIISLNVLNIFRLFQGYGGAAGVTNGQGGKPQGTYSSINLLFDRNEQFDQVEMELNPLVDTIY